MTVQLSMFAGVGAQIFDTNGVPLAGGKIYSYQAGTTTPQTTYTTSAGTAAHTNPIILDSGGRVPNGGEIWLTEAQNYKFILKTSADVLIATYDNVSGNGSNILASLAASNGASLVGFTGFNTTVGTVASLAGNSGSDFIGFIQAGTGAVARSAQNKMRDIFSVKDFGAKGDGVTDDATAIIAAINAAVAATPAVVFFPAGTYKCSTSLGSYTASNLSLVGDNAALDFSSVAVSPAVTMLNFTGSIGSSIALNSDAASSQKTISVSSSSFAAGDFVKITSNSIWDSGRTSTTYGELNFIQAISSASSIAVTNDLMSTYTTAASAKIQKITPVRNINIRGLKLQGPSGNDTHKGIVIFYGINCTIDGIQSYDMDAIHVQFYDSTFCRVFNSYFEESNSATTGYGTSFTDATQDCTAENNIYTNVRHSLTTNNSVAGGVTRRILFANNIVTDSAYATGGTGGDAIDTHAGAEDISIIGNIVNASSGNGINVECRSATVTNNAISFTQGNGITHQNYTDLTGWTNISSNTIRNVMGNYGIAVVPNTASFGTCVINGNDLDLADAPTIRARPTGAFQFVNIDVSSNSIRMTGTGTTPAIDVESVLACLISANSVQAPAIGIRVTTGNSVAITGNSVRLTTTSGAVTGYAVRIEGTSYGCVVNGNALYNDSTLTGANAASFTNTTVTYSGMFGNVGSKFTAATVFNVGTGTGNSAANNIVGL